MPLFVRVVFAHFNLNGLGFSSCRVVALYALCWASDHCYGDWNFHFHQANSQYWIHKPEDILFFTRAPYGKVTILPREDCHGIRGRSTELGRNRDSYTLCYHYLYRKVIRQNEFSTARSTKVFLNSATERHISDRDAVWCSRLQIRIFTLFLYFALLHALTYRQHHTIPSSSGSEFVGRQDSCWIDKLFTRLDRVYFCSVLLMKNKTILVAQLPNTTWFVKLKI